MTDLSFLAGRTPDTAERDRIRRYAIAIPVTEWDGEQHLVFEVRSEKLNRQPGDICFPGGAIEDGETPEQAAVREMTEELLVDSGQIEVIGPADMITGGSRQIYTYVCRLEGEYSFSAAEVSEVFEVPLDFFINTEPEVHRIVWKPHFAEDFPFDRIHGGRDYGWRKQEEDICFYEYGGRVIWGLTARIIRAFVKVIRDSRT